MIVDVYYNLARKCLSVRYRGRVIGHVPAITLRDATFHVSEPGRQRVLENKRKNVHAVVRGEFVKYYAPSELIADRVHYNPYKVATFVKDDGTPVMSAFEVAIHGRLMQVVEDKPFGWDDAAMLVARFPQSNHEIA